MNTEKDKIEALQIRVCVLEGQIATLQATMMALNADMQRRLAKREKAILSNCVENVGGFTK